MQTLDLFPLIESSSLARYRMRVFNVTRWAYHDPTGALMGDYKEDDDIGNIDLSQAPAFKAIVRHSLEDPNRLCEHCPAHVVEASPHGHPDVENGLALLDPIISREDLMRRYAEYCQDPNRGEALWYHQYQNVCLAPSDQRFKAEWCRLVATFPFFQVLKRRALVIDAADKDFQQETGGDYMVALFAEYDDYGRCLVAYGLRSNKWTRQDFINRIIVWCRGTGWWPHIAAKEKFGQDTFLTDLDRAFQAEQKPVFCKTVSRPFTTANNWMKKYDWIVGALQAPLERGEIVWGRDCPKEIRERGEYELTHLSQTKLDDVADTLALLMAPGVRYEAPSKHGDDALPSWVAPSLDLFDPGGHVLHRVSEARELTPVEKAIAGRRFQQIANTLPAAKNGPTDISPQPLNISIDA